MARYLKGSFEISMIMITTKQSNKTVNFVLFFLHDTNVAMQIEPNSYLDVYETLKNNTIVRGAIAACISCEAAAVGEEAACHATSRSSGSGSIGGICLTGHTTLA